MAGRTVIHDAGMIKHSRYKGTAGDVTDSAILYCWNVAGIFTDRTTSAAIMTGITSFTHDFRSAMVDKSTEESSRVMAGTAIFIGALMNRRIRRPSGTNSNVICTSIVAGRAVSGDTRVRKNRRYE